MGWNLERTTGNWITQLHGYKLRLRRSKWGNDTVEAWAISINGTDHGKELTLTAAKGEAIREVEILMNRANR